MDITNRYSNKSQIDVIIDKNLSKKNKMRFIIVDNKTGELVDDAQGYGYRSKYNAYAAFIYKTKVIKNINNKLKKEGHMKETLKLIKNKSDALKFVKSYTEFELLDFYNDSIWFRTDGCADNFSNNFTINHETEGIIGANLNSVVDYVWRNRKKINEWLKDNNTYLVKRKRRH